MTTAATTKNGKTTTSSDDIDIRAFQIPEINVREVTLHVEGLTPLIVHRFSEKAQKAISDAQQKEARRQKEARDPEREWKDAAYILPGLDDLPDWQPGKYTFPASAFKHAFLYGVSQMQDVKKLPKTLATGWFFPKRDPVLQFDSVSLREDTVRISSGTTTLAYRPQFNEWSVELEIDYNANTISIDQVVALLDLGGFSGGIGEWRPSAPKNKSGSFGRFRVTGVSS